jgi:predicted deacylase
MDHDRDYFADSYAEARAGFLAAAARAGARHAHIPTDTGGPGGEPLGIDVATLGAPRPKVLAILTSGVHGIEGYTGSALQRLWLAEFSNGLPAPAAMLLVHGLNPHGFAHGRRTNEHNVDLNRNALAEFPGPANPAYRKLDPWLNPPRPVAAVDDFWLGGLWYLLRAGRAALTQAVAGGQYEFPHGLFYGGHQREASIRVFAEQLAAPAWRAAHRVVHLDLHAGLGRRGDYELLCAVAPDNPSFTDLARWFGAARVFSETAAGAGSYAAQGTLVQLTAAVFPQARTAVVEFGTCSPARVLKALRAENRLVAQGCRSPARARRIRRQLREALYPADPAWRVGVLAHGRELFARLRTVWSRNGA